MSDKTKNECTGHCCKAFTIPYSPEELHSKNKQPYPPRDGVQIEEMLIYLGAFPREETEQRFGCKPEDLQDPKKLLHFYTCKHLVNNRCSIYKTRPRMCAEYPYHNACLYTECTAENKGRDFRDERIHRHFVPLSNLTKERKLVDDST